MLLYIECQSAYTVPPHTSVASHSWVSLLLPHSHHADTLNPLKIILTKSFHMILLTLKLIVNIDKLWNKGWSAYIVSWSVDSLIASAFTPHGLLAGWLMPGRLRFESPSCQKIFCLIRSVSVSPWARVGGCHALAVPAHCLSELQRSLWEGTSWWSRAQRMLRLCWITHVSALRSWSLARLWGPAGEGLVGCSSRCHKCSSKTNR